MRITSKGQVTIPQQIREQAGLHPHTEVEFELIRGRVILRRASTPSGKGREAVSALRALGRKHRKGPFAGMRTDELMKFLRGKD
jgi:AbrB family looped-hinge helix DNA binding protein